MLDDQRDPSVSGIIMNLDLLLVGSIVLAAILYLGYHGIKSLLSFKALPAKESHACGKCSRSEEVS
jgi:hypothetical protein